MCVCGSGGSLTVKSCLTLCDPMDYSPSGFSVRGTSQARIMEWVAISFSKSSSWPRAWACMSCFTGGLLHGRQILYQLSHQGNPVYVPLRVCVCVCVCAYIFFIHLSVDEHLACIHILPIISKAAMNTGVHLSFQISGVGFLSFLFLIYTQEWSFWITW